MNILPTILNGLMVGGLYGLFGLGLAFAFGIMRIVNIAHGEFIVLGAFVGASILSATHLPLPIVVILVAAVSFLLGFALQTVMLNRMIGPNPVPAMVATMGLSIIIRNGLVAWYGADIRAIDIGSLQDEGVSIFGVSIGLLPIIIFGISAALFVLMHLILTQTTLGRAFRAAADDFEILETLGFNRKRVYAIAMGLAVMLSAVAGLLLAIRSSYSPYSGVERLLISFEVVIIGGIGSLRGSFFAGLFLGVVQLVGLKINPNSGPLFGHLAFFLILLAKQADVPALILRRRT
jgi:branched-chain amino acid transport system permease protein